MAEQSFLAKLGLRLGVLGTSASLALAAPLATGNYDPSCHTDAARIGWYFDRAVGAEKIGMIVGGQTGPVYTRSGVLVNAQFTGSVIAGDGTVSANMTINGATSTERTLFYQTAGVNRWGAAANATVESGADAGSDYVITAYADNGSVIDSPMTITRASPGFISFTRRIQMSVPAASTAQFVLSANVGNNRIFEYRTGSSIRWQLLANSTAESGSNAGSDFAIKSYDDSGVLIDTPMTIIRAALGVMSWNRPVLHAAGTLTGSQVAWSTTATWNNVATPFTGWLLNITDTNSATASLLLDLQTGGSTRFNVRKQGLVTTTMVDTDLLGTGAFNYTRTSTLTGNVTDGVHQVYSVAVNGAFTVTRFNYLAIQNPTGTSTITDGCVLRFNAAAGTHKCVDSGSTKTSPGTVSAWLKHNLNGAIVYQPLYTSKTS